VKPTCRSFEAPDRSRFLTPGTSPPWSSPLASLRSSSTTPRPDQPPFLPTNSFLVPRGRSSCLGECDLPRPGCIVSDSCQITLTESGQSRPSCLPICAFVQACDVSRHTVARLRPNLQAGGRRFDPGTLHSPQARSRSGIAALMRPVRFSRPMPLERQNDRLARPGGRGSPLRSRAPGGRKCGQSSRSRFP
jgi:hypothetical protein